MSAQFATLWIAANPRGRVVHRDLGLTPVPLVSEDWIAAAFADPLSRTPAQRAAIAISDELIDELLAADEVVIGAPMFNFGVSASLKAWIDQIVRVGRTVEYPSYAGLVKGKRAMVIATRGLGYAASGPMAEYDTQVPYLRRILGFIGITDVTAISVDNLTISEEVREESLQRAVAGVEAAVMRAGRAR